MDPGIKEIADYSWPLLVILGLAYGGWRGIKALWGFVSTKVWDKLFDESNGLMTIWFSDQHKLVAGLQVALGSIPQTLAAINLKLEELGESYTALGGRNSEMLDSLYRLQSDDVGESKDVARKIDLLIRAKILLTNAETALIQGNQPKAIELQDKARELLEQAWKTE